MIKCDKFEKEIMFCRIQDMTYGVKFHIDIYN